MLRHGLTPSLGSAQDKITTLLAGDRSPLHHELILLRNPPSLARTTAPLSLLSPPSCLGALSRNRASQPGTQSHRDRYSPHYRKLFCAYSFAAARPITEACRVRLNVCVCMYGDCVHVLRRTYRTLYQNVMTTRKFCSGLCPGIHFN